MLTLPLLGSERICVGAHMVGLLLLSETIADAGDMLALVARILAGWTALSVAAAVLWSVMMHRLRRGACGPEARQST